MRSISLGNLKARVARAVQVEPQRMHGRHFNVINECTRSVRCQICGADSMWAAAEGPAVGLLLAGPLEPKHERARPRWHVERRPRFLVHSRELLLLQANPQSRSARRAVERGSSGNG